jgi:nicotinamide mononucleotide transporter
MQKIIEQFAATTNIEWIAFAAALLQVILAVRNHISNFLFGLISVILYTFLSYKGGLYAEACLNVYYAIVSLLGLYYWFGNASQQSSSISYAKPKDWLTAIGITFFCFVISSILLAAYTNSTVPYWDSAVAAFAWSGSWLLAKRKVENWLVLNVSNALAIPLWYYKGYVLTSLLSCILFALAIVGWWQWKKLLQNQTNNFKNKIDEMEASSMHH